MSFLTESFDIIFSLELESAFSEISSYGSLHGPAHLPLFAERPPTKLENKHWPE